MKSTHFTTINGAAVKLTVETTGTDPGQVAISINQATDQELRMAEKIDPEGIKNLRAALKDEEPTFVPYKGTRAGFSAFRD